MGNPMDVQPTPPKKKQDFDVTCHVFFWGEKKNSFRWGYVILSDEHSQRLLHLDRSVVPRRVRVIQGEDENLVVRFFGRGNCTP